jgi:hypothetical protein
MALPAGHRQHQVTRRPARSRLPVSPASLDLRAHEEWFAQLLKLAARGREPLTVQPTQKGGWCGIIPHPIKHRASRQQPVDSYRYFVIKGKAAASPFDRAAKWCLRISNPVCNLVPLNLNRRGGDCGRLLNWRASRLRHISCYRF